MDGGSVSPTANGAAGGASFLEFNSKIYAIWERGLFGISNIQVAVLTDGSGGKWTSVSPNWGLNHNPGVSAGYGKLTVFNSKLYATWYEYDSTAQIRVAVYNGDDLHPLWSFVDGNGGNGLNATPQHAFTPQLIGFNSKLYLAWREGGATPYYPGQIRVRVYNGNDGAPLWSFVDGGTGINVDPTRAAGNPVFAIHGSSLYLTWSEGYWTTGNPIYVRVKVYNGNDGAPAWTQVDGSSTGLNVDASLLGLSPALVEYNSKLYCGWNEGNSIHIKVFNDSIASPAWSSVDGSSAGLRLNNNAAANATDVNFAVFNGILHLIGREVFYSQSGETGLLYVRTYNGNDAAPVWSLLDNTTIPLNASVQGIAESGTLIVHESALYAGWSEQDPAAAVPQTVRFAKHTP